MQVLFFFVYAYVVKNCTPYPRKTIQVLLRIIVILNMSYSSPKYTVYLVGKNENVYDWKVHPVPVAR